MRIRCERCATVYELDERRLPAEGAPVKCTRCQHVFRAVPPPPADAAPEARPASPEGASPPPVAPESVPTGERTAVFDFARTMAPERTESFAAAPPAVSAPSRHAGPAAGEGVGVPAPHGPVRPRAAGPAPVARKAPATGRSWMIFLLLALAVALAAAWLVSRRRAEGAAGRLAPFQAMLARDDRASLERLAGAAASSDDGELRALGALASIWLAEDAAEEGAPLRSRVLALEAQENREQQEQAPGWTRRQAQLRSRLEDARREAAPSEERVRKLLAAAASSEGAARSAGASELSLLRVRAAREAALSAPGLERTVRLAAAVDASDPWIELARNRDAAARGAPDLPALRGLAGRYPRVLRGRVLLARVLRAAGNEGDAVRILDEVLAENGEHEVAKAIKADVLAPPRAAVSRVEVGTSAPPVRAGGYLPRLKPRS